MFLRCPVLGEANQSLVYASQPREFHQGGHNQTFTWFTRYVVPETHSFYFDAWVSSQAVYMPRRLFILLLPILTGKVRVVHETSSFT